ncbi:ABC transporter ATP-binding protein [Parvularcula marina]|uniref:ABC transporter ATP-binding protein n=1 Tax=Parvularcula marina TaxID=2292771 RepID=A0A371RH89_9PROT|nr:ABC transporter ATP-binding protein [Parvularcula marina]
MIRVEDVGFAYGSQPPAIDGLSFEIAKGEIFGFLGPSGAGKTTTQKILLKLLKGYSGTIEVMGRPLSSWGRAYFQKIGVCFEFPSNYAKLTALENLRFFAGFFSGPTADPMQLLEEVGLGHAANQRVEQFSKGMQIRLNVARSLLNNPELLFLDEPTAGLDPANARAIRDLIARRRDEGATVFLTTHDMAVAEALCDRVGLLVHGKLAALDAPRTLRLAHGERKVEVSYVLEGQPGTEIFDLDGLDTNERFTHLLHNAHIETLHTLEPTLDDVFIKLAGRTS